MHDATEVTRTCKNIGHEFSYHNMLQLLPVSFLDELDDVGLVEALDDDEMADCLLRLVTVAVLVDIRGRQIEKDPSMSAELCPTCSKLREALRRWGDKAEAEALAEAESDRC